MCMSTRCPLVPMQTRKTDKAIQSISGSEPCTTQPATRLIRSCPSLPLADHADCNEPFQWENTELFRSG